MKTKKSITDFIIIFCVITTFITILEAILGCLLMPSTPLSYKAFFSPPLLGFFSTIIARITQSDKELTLKQVLFRQFIRLLMIEFLVFGVNYLTGATFEKDLTIALASGIALIFVLINVILWCNDKQNATEFNKNLKIFQEKQNSLSE